MEAIVVAGCVVSLITSFLLGYGFAKREDTRLLREVGLMWERLMEVAEDLEDRGD